MRRTSARDFSGLALLTAAAFMLGGQSAWAGNIVTWDSANSKIDTTNYTGLAPYYWFANFNSPNPVTGQPMDQNEARNLPSWIKLESRSDCIGRDVAAAPAWQTRRFAPASRSRNRPRAFRRIRPVVNRLTTP
jgi:hypothetical protein